MTSPPAKNALPWLIVSIVVIALDQWSKNWVLASLPEYTPVVVIEGFWNWYRSYNTGAAFSFLSDAGGWQKYFFLVLAVGISGLLARWRTTVPRRRIQAWTLEEGVLHRLLRRRRLAVDTVGGDEQVGQRPLGCAETFDFGRLVETFLL